MPYALAMDILKASISCYQRNDQIICISCSDIYPLLQSFTSSVDGGGQYYVLLLVVLSLPERVYVSRSTQSDLCLNLYSVVHQVINVAHLINQFLTGLPGIYTIMEVSTYQRSATQSAALPPMIEGIRPCLSVVLVFNSFTISQRKGKNVYCKTFLYRTREMTQSRKLLFCIVKRNDFVIELFIDLYLCICVYIYVSQICTHIICVYVVSCFPCKYWD